MIVYADRSRHVPLEEAMAPVRFAADRLRFGAVPAQLAARDLIQRNAEGEYAIALTFASRAPAWLAGLGLEPMSLGLDLRRGMHLVYEVDVAGAVSQLPLDFFGPIADDGNDPLNAGLRQGIKDELDHRAAEDRDEDLGQLRFHPRPLAGGQNDGNRRIHARLRSEREGAVQSYQGSGDE